MPCQIPFPARPAAFSLASVFVATRQHTSRLSAFGNRATYITIQCLWQQGNTHHASVPVATGQHVIHQSAVPVATEQHTSRISACGNRAIYISPYSACGNSATFITSQFLWQQRNMRVPVATALYTTRVSSCGNSATYITLELICNVIYFAMIETTRRGIVPNCFFVAAINQCI